MILEKEGKKTVEVLEVKKGAIKTTFKNTNQIKEVFVYGVEVNDFHTVDYEAISMLNVSATQELYKKLKELEQENNELKTLINEKYNTQDKGLEELKAQLVKIQELLGATVKK